MKLLPTKHDGIQEYVGKDRFCITTKDGIKVYFGGKGFSAAFSKKGGSRDIFVAIARINEILSTGEYLEDSPNEKFDSIKKAKRKVESYRYYARKVSINGAEYYAQVTLEKIKEH